MQERYGKEKTVVDNFLPLDKDNQKSLRINAFGNVHIKQISNKEKYLWILLISIIDYIAYVFFVYIGLILVII